MKFYHGVSVSALQGFMQGKPLGAIPTLCPTPNLIDYGVLTLYCQRQCPLAWRLVQQDPLEGIIGDPGSYAYMKLGFTEQGDGNNQPSASAGGKFTLTILTKKGT